MIAFLCSSLHIVDFLLEDTLPIAENQFGDTSILLREKNGTAFLIIITGFGKANIGFSICYALSFYTIEKMVLVGSCASLQPQQCPLHSLALATSFLQYDVDFTALGYCTGQYPLEESKIFPSDSTLVDKVISQGNAENKVLHTGLCISGDRFVSSKYLNRKLTSKFGACFLDCESAVLATIATRNQVPFLMLKGVSNYANESAAAQHAYNRAKANQLSCSFALSALL